MVSNDEYEAAKMTGGYHVRAVDPAECQRIMKSDREIGQSNTTQLGVIGGFVLKITVIWIDPVKLAMRFSKSPGSMWWIQGAAGMNHDGRSC